MAYKSSEITLKHFFIFNSNYGPNEGDEANKILFFSPISSTDIDGRIKEVGLCEAIIKFTNTFTSDDDSCHTFRTQKTAQFYYQCESNYWMVLTLNIPYEKKIRDGNEYNEYKADEVNDKIYREILIQAYRMFRLFFGTFELNAIGLDLDEQAANLRKKLEHFYTRYLLTLKLHNCDILNVFKSVQYLPLHRLLFLRVNNFIQMIESTFPMIKHCIFLYDEQLVWSEINPIDLYSIYEYLLGTLLRKATETELKGGALTRSYSLDASTGHYGSFVTGPNTWENCVKVPTVFIYNQQKCSTYLMIVYRALSATICMFVDETKTGSLPLNDELYQELHAFIGPQLTNIATEIGETFLNTKKSNTSTASSATTTVNASSSSSASASSSSSSLLTASNSTLTNFINNSGNDSIVNGPKYLLFNELSLQHDGIIHVHPTATNGKMKKSQIPNDVMNLIVDLYNDCHIKPQSNSNGGGDSASGGSADNTENKTNNICNTEEIVVKTLNDYWIVKRSSNWRHFFVIINKSSTLLEITDEAKKIFDQHLKNLFFER